MVKHLALGLSSKRDRTHIVVIGGGCTDVCEMVLGISDRTPHYRITFVNSPYAEDVERQFPRASVIFWTVGAYADAAEFINPPIDWLYADPPMHRDTDVYEIVASFAPLLGPEALVAFHGYGKDNVDYSNAIDYHFRGLEWVVMETVDPSVVGFRRRIQYGF